MVKRATKKEKPRTIVISLGGSLICPQDLDIKFIKTFTSLVKNDIRRTNNKYIIIAGGGYVCRRYLNVFDKIRGKTNTTPSKDNIGIAVTQVNAKLIQALLAESGAKTHPTLLNNPTKKIHWGTYKVAIGCGFKPGHSTDYDAVLAAIANKATSVINLTNIDYVYTKDPRKYKNAKPLKELTWEQYKKVLGVTTWKAGLHTPFDPLASKLAQQHKLTVAIVNGRKFKALKSITSKETRPIGTRISSTKR